MIGSIIDYARGTTGSRKRAVDMKALCANAIATIDQEEGRLAFRAPEEDCTVNGDPMTLHRLIANLAVNALRYAGGGELTLEGNAHGIVARMRTADRVSTRACRKPVRAVLPRGRVTQPRNRRHRAWPCHRARRGEAHGGTLTAANRAGGGADSC
jgi:hypothetical protein